MFGKPSFGKPPGSTQDWYLTKQPAGQPKQPSGNTQYAGGTPNLSGRPVAPGRAQSQQQPSAGTPYGAYATPSSQTTGDPRGAYATAPPSQRPPPMQIAPAQTPWGQSMDPFAERDAFVNQIGQQRINNQIAFNTSGPQAPQGSPFINYDMARQNAGLAGGAPSMNANPADTFIGRFNNQYGAPVNPGFGGGQPPAYGHSVLSDPKMNPNRPPPGMQEEFNARGETLAFYPKTGWGPLDSGSKVTSTVDFGPGPMPTQPSRPGNAQPIAQPPQAYYPGGPGGFPTQPPQGAPYQPPSQGTTQGIKRSPREIAGDFYDPNPGGVKLMVVSYFHNPQTGEEYGGTGVIPRPGTGWVAGKSPLAKLRDELSQAERDAAYPPRRWDDATRSVVEGPPGAAKQYAQRAENLRRQIAEMERNPAAPAPALPPAPAPGSQPRRGRSADIRSPDEIEAEARTKASQESPEWKAAVEASRPGRAQPIAPPSQGDPYAVGDLTKLPFYKSLMVGDTVRLNERGQYTVFDSAGKDVQQYGNASQGHKLIFHRGGRTGATIWGSTPEGAAEQAADLKRLEERDRPAKEAFQKEAASKIARLDELRKKQHQWSKSSASTGAGGRGLVKGRDGNYVTPWQDEYMDLINWSSKAKYDPNLTPQQRGLIEGWFPGTKVAGNRAYY